MLTSSRRDWRVKPNSFSSNSCNPSRKARSCVLARHNRSTATQCLMSFALFPRRHIVIAALRSTSDHGLDLSPTLVVALRFLRLNSSHLVPAQWSPGGSLPTRTCELESCLRNNTRNFQLRRGGLSEHADKYGGSAAHRETKFCDTVIAGENNVPLVPVLALASLGDLTKLHS